MTDQKLDIVVPVSLDPLWQGADIIAERIRYQYEKFGFTRFALFGPSKGWRAEGYPTREYYREMADSFLHVKKLVHDIPVQCGWIVFLTIKTGAFSNTSGVIKSDGTAHPVSCCPTDQGFRTRLLEDIRMFVEIGEPAFLLLEDDYTLSDSCFCDRHLEMFSERMGKKYTCQRRECRI